MREHPNFEPESTIAEGVKVFEEIGRMVDDGKQGPDVARYLFSLGAIDLTLAAAVLTQAGFLALPAPDANGVTVSINLYTGEAHPRSTIVTLDQNKGQGFRTEPE